MDILKGGQLLGDRVVVKPDDPEETTKSGILLPKTLEKKMFTGTVLAVGAGRWIPHWKKGAVRQEMEVKVGDKVLFPRYTGMNFKATEEATLILRQADLFCVITEE